MPKHKGKVMRNKTRDAGMSAPANLNQEIFLKSMFG
jgi:hypothetical protein